MSHSDLLILTREPGQSLLIGEEVSITIMDAEAGQVRLGVQAPRDIPVYKEDNGEAVPADDTQANPGE